MPYQIEWRERGVYWSFTGVVTGEDILQSNFDIYGDARFDDLTYQIVDLLDAEKIEVTELHMKKVAHLDAAACRSNSRIRVAIVAREVEAARLQELYVKHSSDDSWPTLLFETLEAAEAWVLSES